LRCLNKKEGIAIPIRVVLNGATHHLHEWSTNC